MCEMLIFSPVSGSGISIVSGSACCMSYQAAMAWAPWRNCGHSVTSSTFSAFSLETALMIERGQMGGAALYALLSVCLSVLALFGGLFTMRAVA